MASAHCPSLTRCVFTTRDNTPDNSIRTGGEATLDWVMNNTAILHFCGRDKPWAPKYRGQFAALYKHYATLARRI